MNQRRLTAIQDYDSVAIKKRKAKGRHKKQRQYLDPGNSIEE